MRLIAVLVAATLAAGCWARSGLHVENGGRTVHVAVATTSTTRTTTTTTRYALVPGPTVQFQQFVGHKVEVTGMMVPEGESKTTTTTKVDRDNGPDTKTKETVKREGDMAQFRVMSIKHLADSCAP